jgi:hypothetical protein
MFGSLRVIGCVDDTGASLSGFATEVDFVFGFLLVWCPRAQR